MGFGVIPAAINLLLFLFVFKKESLKYIVQQGDRQNEALPFLKQIYKTEDESVLKQLLEEEKKLTQHQGVEAGDSTPNTRFRKKAEAVGWAKILCDPLYTTCTYSICALAAFNQGTGVNSINVYSQQIFENIQEESGGGGISPRVGNCLVTLAQFFAVFFTPFVL